MLDIAWSVSIGLYLASSRLTKGSWVQMAIEDRNRPETLISWLFQVVVKAAGLSLAGNWRGASGLY